MGKLDTLYKKKKEVAEVAALRNKRHQLFAISYALGAQAGNGAGSYRAAGYDPSPTNKNTAAVLLKRPDIRAAVASLRGEIEEASKEPMTPGERLSICAQIARDAMYPPRARLAAIRLDAELRGGFKAPVEDVDIIVDLVGPPARPDLSVVKGG